MEASCLSSQSISAAFSLQDSSGKAQGPCSQTTPFAEESPLKHGELERLAAIGRSVTCFTHQASNVLQCSQVCLRLLSLEVADRPQATDFVQRLQRAQDSLHRLCEDVRQYAAPLRLQPRCCDVREIWFAAWEALRWRRDGRAVFLQEHTSPSEARASVDPFYLEQVFANLFDNALAACCDPAEVTIRCSVAEIDGRPGLAVAVGDNGPGFSAEQLHRPFSAFVTTKRGGTGLGLLIARNIVEAHGGLISLGASPAGGAEIRLVLPGDRG
jgi:signal transduction histidine kinase